MAMLPLYYYYLLFLFLFFSSSSSNALSPLIRGGGSGEAGVGGIPRHHHRRSLHRHVPVGGGVLDERRPREQAPAGDDLTSRRRTARSSASSSSLSSLSSSSSYARPVISAHLSMVDGVPGGDVDPLQPQPSPQAQRTVASAVAYFPSPDVDVDAEGPTTSTQWEPSSAGVAPSRPRIVVFGASGRIGRRVLGRLLSSSLEIDVVAFVRDRERLERSMYDDEDVVVGNLVDDGRGGRRGNAGPRLRIVVGDAVSRRDVCRGAKEKEDASLRGRWADWARRRRADRDDRASSGSSSTTPDRGGDGGSTANVDDIDQEEEGGGEEEEAPLRDALAGATVLISCLGSRRSTNLWTDYLRVPVLRIFRGEDVGRWCDDPTHPYYVNYLSTRRILEGAEMEQRRREAILEFERERSMLEERLDRAREKHDKKEEEEGFESEIATGLRKKRNHDLRGAGRREGHDHHHLDGRDAVALPRDGKLLSSNDRVKFIRMSHLMVGRSPFRIRDCLTNILWSQVSRYELMGEMLMEESTLVDTVVLRPGDLTDEERNHNNTSLQLCIDGTVPSPSLVGRDDVADLAVVTALTKTSSRRNPLRPHAGDSGSIVSGDTEAPPSRSANHWTWAVRWTGQHLSPPQGLRPDGCADAATCFDGAVKEQTALDRNRRTMEKYLESYHGGRELLRLSRWRRKMKPYAQSLAVSIPVYLTLGILSWYLFGQAFVDLFSRLKRLCVALNNI